MWCKIFRQLSGKISCNPLNSLFCILEIVYTHNSLCINDLAYVQLTCIWPVSSRFNRYSENPKTTHVQRIILENRLLQRGPIFTNTPSTMHPIFHTTKIHPWDQTVNRYMESGKVKIIQGKFINICITVIEISIGNLTLKL